ncbi:hypothetical protein KKA39_00930 [Patescibacteria group bacterium]|nr:hypothetical protein [Patescibacteria group bacterium]MBU1727858.1 hypothetical protein [Patescibacteria group bacterium]
MIVENLPTTGWINLKSSRKKWNHFIEKGCGVHAAGSIEFENEKVEVNIFITNTFSVDSIEEKAFDMRFYNLGSNCYHFLKGSSGQGARAYEGYLLYEGKEILLLIVEYPELEKLVYFFDVSEGCVYFPKYSQN